MKEIENQFRDNSYIQFKVQKTMENFKTAGRHKVAMKGIYDDLTDLKSRIESLYTEKVFDLDSWTDDAPYHGWSWKDNYDELQNIIEITGGIEDRFIEIYSLILLGLGEEIEDTPEDSKQILNPNIFDKPIAIVKEVQESETGITVNAELTEEGRRVLLPTKLEKIVDFLIEMFPKGIQMFNTRGIDPVDEIYLEDDAKILYSAYWEYIEALGLSDEEYKELQQMLNKRGWNYW